MKTLQKVIEYLRNQPDGYQFTTPQLADELGVSKYSAWYQLGKYLMDYLRVEAVDNPNNPQGGQIHLYTLLNNEIPDIKPNTRGESKQTKADNERAYTIGFSVSSDVFDYYKSLPPGERSRVANKVLKSNLKKR